MPDTLEPERVSPLLRGRFGIPYLYARSCDSTQSLLSGDMAEGTVAVAEYQAAGRGRRGRRWEAPAGVAILCSVLVRPPVARPLPQLALVAGLALALGLERSTGLACRVKWPNDVLVDGRKVAGVLAEGRGDWAALGFGINVNQSPADLPVDTRTSAGSLRAIDGVVRDRAPLLVAVLDELERAYASWCVAGLSALLPALRERDALGGRRIVLDGKPGQALGIAMDGRLEVELAGEHLLVASGEVIFAD